MSLGHLVLKYNLMRKGDSPLALSVPLGFLYRSGIKWLFIFCPDYVLPKPVLISSIDCGVSLALWLLELVLPSLAQPPPPPQDSIHSFL